jgi:hypothetical protein
MDMTRLLQPNSSSRSAHNCHHCAAVLTAKQHIALMMGTEIVPETLVDFNELTRLIARGYSFKQHDIHFKTLWRPYKQTEELRYQDNTTKNPVSEVYA